MYGVGVYPNQGVCSAPGIRSKMRSTEKGTGNSMQGLTRHTTLAAFVLTSVFLLAGVCFADDSKPPFLIIGHAGSPTKQPDNTIEGFEQALKDGANAVEMDLCITGDHQVVSWHDWDPDSTISLARQAGLQDFKYRPWNPNLDSAYRVPVDQLTLKQFRRHYGYTSNQNNSALTGAATKTHHQIPTFEQIAKWMAGKDQLEMVYLDIKIPADKPEYVSIYIDQIYAAAKKYGVEDKLVFFSPHLNIALQAKRYTEANNIPLKIGLDQELPASPVMSLDPKKYDVAQKSSNLGFEYGSIGRPTAVTMVGGWSSYSNILQRMNRLKNQSGTSDAYKKTQLIAWTINDEEEIKWLLKNGGHGINGIMSDDPAKVAYYVRKYVGRTELEDARKKLLWAKEELDQAANDLEDTGFFGSIWEFFSGSKKRALKRAQAAYEQARYRYQKLLFTGKDGSKPSTGGSEPRRGITRDGNDDM